MAKKTESGDPFMGKLSYYFGILETVGTVLTTSSSNSSEQNTPATSKMAKMFQTYGKMKNYQVEITGKENIPQQADRNTVNLILPSHREPMQDATIMGDLAPTNYLLFINTKACMPTKMTGMRLAEDPSMIGVGRWRPMNPTNKMMLSLMQNRSRNIFNYPQGFVANTGEINGIHRSFTQKLIGRLLGEEAHKKDMADPFFTKLKEKSPSDPRLAVLSETPQYNVNIIPVSYEVSSIFLQDEDHITDKNLEAKVNKPITGRMTRYLRLRQIESGEEDDYIGTLLRSFWLKDIVNHGELTMDELISRWESVYQRTQVKEESTMKSLVGRFMSIFGETEASVPE